MRTGCITLIATEHWLAIGVVANEPSKRWQPCRSLQIDNSLNDAAHIIGSSDSPVKLDGILPDVASNGLGIRMARVKNEIFEAHPITAQKRQACTATAMPRNFPLASLTSTPAFAQRRGIIPYRNHGLPALVRLAELHYVMGFHTAPHGGLFPQRGALPRWDECAAD